MKTLCRLFLASLPMMPLATGAADAAKSAPPAGSARAGAAGTPAPGFSMDNCLRPFDPAATGKTSVGYQFWFADGTLAPDASTVKISVVGPRLGTHAPHRHAEDEFFFVLEGTAEFFLDGERRTGGPLTLFYCPSWHEHGIRNVGDSELKYLVMKKQPGPAAKPSTSVKQVPGAAQPPGVNPPK
jgi:quercetin dioxygenase-like cupin family protein